MLIPSFDCSRWLSPTLHFTRLHVNASWYCYLSPEAAPSATHHPWTPDHVRAFSRVISLFNFGVEYSKLSMTWICQRPRVLVFIQRHWQRWFIYSFFPLFEQVGQDWWILVKRGPWIPSRLWGSSRGRTSPPVPKYEFLNSTDSIKLIESWRRWGSCDD